jgi:benzoyl-CoA 2,3-dioxygenase component A
LEIFMSTAELTQQHLIDPGICIRCNTCEETCPINAITHDARNYVVKADICNNCRACVPPCPTGAIDNWFPIEKGRPYSLEEQYSWDELPVPSMAPLAAPGEVPADVARITAEATAGQGGPVAAPWSAAVPAVNLYNEKGPITATVSGNLRLTAEDASASFPLLEGQNIGIVPPGTDGSGRPHHVRLYSVASPRDGERPGYNNMAITVKRVTNDHESKPVRGVCSNYLCDLKKGDKVQVIGPFGANFLMPNHPGSSLMMICTGTGSAPMRAMTERRRRRIQQNEGGRLMLFFGARAPGELPYFGPLTHLPKEFIDINLAFSRVPGHAKQYVQDLIRFRHDDVHRMLMDEDCYIYLCGLKGMEKGVDEAFRDVCRMHGADWEELLPQLREKSRYHVETY